MRPFSLQRAAVEGERAAGRPRLLSLATASVPRLIVHGVDGGCRSASRCRRRSSVNTAEVLVLPAAPIWRCRSVAGGRPAQPPACPAAPNDDLAPDRRARPQLQHVDAPVNVMALRPTIPATPSAPTRPLALDPGQPPRHRFAVGAPGERAPAPCATVATAAAITGRARDAVGAGGPTDASRRQRPSRR